MEKTCHIVGAGPFEQERLEVNEGDYVIAADGGYLHLQKLGTVSDMLLGDFDSLGDVPFHPNTIRLDPVKDDTDMMFAVKTAMDMGYRRFMLYGGLGGRLDHTLANIQALAYLSRRGARGFLLGGGAVITAVTNGKLEFDIDCRGYVSVFCHGEWAKGVYERGLKYSLTGALLTNDMPLGVSNEFTGERSFVSVEDGTLIVMWRRENTHTGLGVIENQSNANSF